MKPFLKHIITQAGAISLEYRARLSTVSFSRKATAKDLVTEADVAVEKYLIEQIRSRCPEHGVCGEESGDHAGNDCRWVIDPIDGTTSFVHNLPFYSISIALQQNEQTILAAVYAPVLDELFFAEKGGGATLNDAPIRVSDRNVLSDCVLATGFACLRANLPRHNLPLINAVAPHLRGMRMLGSAAMDLCWVACGRLDGSWELNLNLYDIAAGMLIVTEAGGTVTDFSGVSADKLPGEIMATNGWFHTQLAAFLSQ